MKTIQAGLFALLACAPFCVAGEPSLTVYQRITEDDILESTDFPDRPELHLKLYNSGAQPRYILGFSINLPYYIMEVEKDGRWEERPSPITCWTSSHLRRILPDSYLVFSVGDLPISERDCTFRIKVRLLTEPTARDGSGNNFVEVVSPPISTREFRASKLREPAAPAIPGLE